MYIVDGQTRIGTVHLQTAETDQFNTRLRLSTMLAALDFVPANLVPSAILCIRNFKDPRPGSLRLQPGGYVNHLWKQALTSALERTVREARYPNREVVPASAEAVIFNDRAELLACLASDWCAGNVANYWWWPALLETGKLTGSIVAVWLEAGEYVPAALVNLAQNHRAVEFVRRLSENETSLLLDGLITRFGLSHFRPVLASPARTNAGPAVGPVNYSGWPASSLDLPVAAPNQGQPTGLPAPWLPWVEQNPELNVISQILLAVGLLLERVPQVVRSSDFAGKVHRWQNLQPGPDLSRVGPDQRVALSESDALAENPPDPVENTSQSAESGFNQPTGELPLSSKIEGEPESLTETVKVADLYGGTSPEPAQFEISEEDSDLQINRPETAAPGKLVSEPTINLATSSKIVKPQAQSSINTKWGGIFYLINLGQNLGLYADFTTPNSPGIDLSIWDWLVLTGQRLLGATAEAVWADPVWSLLAQLAGREEGELPGRSFVPHVDWQLPPDWLSWLSEKSMTEPIPPTCYDPPSGPNLESWLDWLMPIILIRLESALGLNGSSGTELGEFLCGQAAQVWLSPARVDLYFELAVLPVEIRLAGLDRDPGWVPAGGRFVAFHYV